MALVEDLRQTFRDKPTSVVLIVGAGVSLSALRGAPCSHLATWEGLLRSGLQRIHELQRINADELLSYQGILTHGNLKAWLMVAGRIEEELGAPTHGEFRRWLRETVGTFERHVTDRSVLDAIAAHQQRGSLLATTNYDLLLEDVTKLHAVTWRDPASVERALRGDEPQVLHLHGAWRWPESIVIGSKSYADVVENAHAQAVLTTLRTDRTFVFVGCGAGLRDPNLGAFLRWTADVFTGSEYRHFRLCLDAEVDDLKREHPAEQRIFPLPYGADHTGLAPFLRSLLPVNKTAQPEQIDERLMMLAAAAVGSANLTLTPAEAARVERKLHELDPNDVKALWKIHRAAGNVDLDGTEYGNFLQLRTAVARREATDALDSELLRREQGFGGVGDVWITKLAHDLLVILDKYLRESVPIFQIPGWQPHPSDRDPRVVEETIIAHPELMSLIDRLVESGKVLDACYLLPEVHNGRASSAPSLHISFSYDQATAFVRNEHRNIPIHNGEFTIRYSEEVIPNDSSNKDRVDAVLSVEGKPDVLRSIAHARRWGHQPS